MTMKISFAALFLCVVLVAGCGQQKKPLSMAGLELYLNSHYLDANGYDSLLALYPESDFLTGLKAMTLNEEGDTAKARRWLEDTEKRHPAWKKSVYLTLAKAALAIDGGDTLAQRRLVGMLEQEDARKKNKWVSLMLYQTRMETDTMRAERHLQDALALDTGFTQAKIAGLYRFRVEDSCDSVLSRFRLIPSTYLDPVLTGHIGLAYHYCGDSESAVLWAKKSLSISPNYLGHYVLATVAHLDMQNYREAEKQYLLVIRHDPHHWFDRTDLGWLYHDSGDLEKAERLFKELAAMNPGQDIQDELVIFYIKSKQYGLAGKANQASVKMFGENYRNAGLALIINALQIDDIGKAAQGMLPYMEIYGKQGEQWVAEVFGFINE